MFHLKWTQLFSSTIKLSESWNDFYMGLELKHRNRKFSSMQMIKMFLVYFNLLTGDLHAPA